MVEGLTIDHKRMEAAGMPPPTIGKYSRIKGVATSAAIASGDQLVNVRINMGKDYPRFEKLPEFNKLKGNTKKIALVGGGPSLKNNLEELKTFKTIISCGSVHDYLMSVGIVPTYAANCDPDKISSYYFTKPDSEIKYLISSNSHPSVFETLKDYQVVMWHCHSDEQKEELIKLETEKGNTYNGVGGGCTVGLRSICLALSMGYSNIHFFGFDSCVADEEGKEHHAYGYASDEEEKIMDKKIHKIRLGHAEGPSSKEYYVVGYQLAQLENFKDFYCAHRMYFKPTFHGGGALDAFHKMIESDLEQQLAM